MHPVSCMVSSSILLKSGFLDALPFLYVGVKIKGKPVLIRVLSCPDKSSFSMASSPNSLLHGWFFCLFFHEFQVPGLGTSGVLKMSFFSLTYLL